MTRTITKEHMLTQLNAIKLGLTDSEKSDGTLTNVNELIEEITNSPEGTVY